LKHPLISENSISLCSVCVSFDLSHYCSGYFEGKPKFLEEAKAKKDGTIDFYDSNTGKLLFTAPKGRSMDAFLTESRAHGWPSFRGKICLSIQYYDRHMLTYMFSRLTFFLQQ
jgi:hypothetical protein